MAGLTPEGFITKREPEIIEATETALRDRVDPNIDTRDDEYLGQHIAISSTQKAEMWEVLESLYDSWNIDKADGISLDNLGILRDLPRIEASAATYEFQEFTGQDGTVIPDSSTMGSTEGIDFFVDGEVTIGITSCNKFSLTVENVLDSTIYLVTIDNTDFSFTSDASATEEEILAGLQTLLDADSTITASVNGSQVDVVLEDFLEVILSTDLGTNSVTSKGKVQAQNTGAISLAPDTVIYLNQFVTGFISTTNPTTLTSGTDRESDSEYRARLKSTRTSARGGTLPAIYQRLIQVENVQSVTIEENDEGFTVDGRPEHTYECIVVGGLDQDIADVLLDTKSAGVKTFGNTSVISEMDNGQQIVVRFSRPSDINLAVRVSYDLYSEEMPTDQLEAAIKQAVKDYTDTLAAGNDFIPTRTYGDIYGSTSGIGSLIVEYQVIANSGDTPSGTWLTATLPISAAEVANTELVDIYTVEN